MNEYKVLSTRGKEIKTNIALHPGDILLDELEAREIRKIDFAKQLEMKPSHFSELLHKKRNVSASTALKLERILGIDAEYWMRVQVYYELFHERKKSDKVQEK
jgi:HTH-type transcriptional regulator/antitoxin HigA